MRKHILKGFLIVLAGGPFWGLAGLPEGLAQQYRPEPAGELRPHQQLEEVLEPETFENASAEDELPETSERFLMPSSLEPAESEDAYAIEQVRKLLRSDLARSFGLGSRRVEALAGEGNIRFEIDIDSEKASVIIEGSVQREAGEGSLLAPLEGGFLPRRIDYRLGHQQENASSCLRAEHCGSEAEYFLNDAVFTAENAGRKLRYLLDYRTENSGHATVFNALFSNSELKQVSVYDVTHEKSDSCAEGLLCGQFVQNIRISRERLESTGGAGWKVRIAAGGGLRDIPVEREIFLREEQGLLFATLVTDYAARGKPLSRTALEYEVRDASSVCEGPDCGAVPEISLWRVLRRENGGNRSSEVQGFWKTNDGRYSAGVKFTGGKTASVIFQSVEELLRELSALQRGF